MDLKLFISEAHCTVSPFLAPAIWQWKCVDMYLSSNNTAFLKTLRWCHLESRLYIRKWSKSRWPWLRLNAGFVCACVCACVCVRSCANTAVEICVHVTMESRSFIFFQSHEEFPQAFISSQQTRQHLMTLLGTVCSAHDPGHIWILLWDEPYQAILPAALWVYMSVWSKHIHVLSVLWWHQETDNPMQYIRNPLSLWFSLLSSNNFFSIQRQTQFNRITNVKQYLSQCQ